MCTVFTFQLLLIQGERVDLPSFLRIQYRVVWLMIEYWVFFHFFLSTKVLGKWGAWWGMYWCYVCYSLMLKACWVTGAFSGGLRETNCVCIWVGHGAAVLLSLSLSPLASYDCASVYASSILMAQITYAACVAGEEPLFPCATCCLCFVTAA